MKVTLTLIDPKNIASGKMLQARSRGTVRIDLNKNHGQWRNGLTLLTQTSRYADSANTRELNGYTTVDLNSHYALNKSWTIKGKVKNLFNEAYRTTDTTYKPSERTFMLSVNYNFRQE